MKEKNDKSYLVSKIFKNVIFILFVAFSLFLLFKHELWRDEAQNWLLNRDLSLRELTYQLKIEGHPILWYLVLRPFVKLGFSYALSGFIPLVITLIAVYLIINYFPYNPFVVLVTLCNPFIIYLAPIFVRSYCLIALLFVLLAILYKKRYEYPVFYGLCIAALLNTHVMVCGLPLALLGIEFISLFKKKNSRKDILKILVIGILGIIILILQLYGSSSSSNLESLFINMSDSLDYILMCVTCSVFLKISFISLLIISVVYLMYKKEFAMLFVMLCSFMSVLTITACFHKNYYLCFLIIPGIIFVFWNIKEKTILSQILFVSIMACFIYATSIYVRYELDNNYSSSAMTAEYIEKNIPKGTEIGCNYIANCSAIIPFFPKNTYSFIDLALNKPFTYVDWNDYDVPERFHTADSVTSDYIIVTGMQERSDYENYDVIYTSDESLFESYMILKHK